MLREKRISNSRIWSVYYGRVRYICKRLYYMFSTSTLRIEVGKFSCWFKFTLISLSQIQNSSHKFISIHLLLAPSRRLLNRDISSVSVSLSVCLSVRPKALTELCTPTGNQLVWCEQLFLELSDFVFTPLSSYRRPTYGHQSLHRFLAITLLMSQAGPNPFTSLCVLTQLPLS